MHLLGSLRGPTQIQSCSSTLQHHTRNVGTVLSLVPEYKKLSWRQFIARVCFSSSSILDIRFDAFLLGPLYTGKAN